jgi:hypothetical protein
MRISHFSGLFELLQVYFHQNKYFSLAMRQQIKRQERLKSDSNEINSPTLEKTFNIQLDESSLTLRKQFQNNKQHTLRESIFSLFLEILIKILLDTFQKF